MMRIDEGLEIALQDQVKVGESSTRMDFEMKVLAVLIIVLTYVWWSQI